MDEAKPEWLRQRAEHFRELASTADSGKVSEALASLADAIERRAQEIEDRRILPPRLIP